MHITWIHVGIVVGIIFLFICACAMIGDGDILDFIAVDAIFDLIGDLLSDW